MLTGAKSHCYKTHLDLDPSNSSSQKNSDDVVLLGSRSRNSSSQKNSDDVVAYLKKTRPSEIKVSP